MYISDNIDYTGFQNITEGFLVGFINKERDVILSCFNDE